MANKPDDQHCPKCGHVYTYEYNGKKVCFHCRERPDLNHWQFSEIKEEWTHTFDFSIGCMWAENREYKRLCKHDKWLSEAIDRLDDNTGD